MIFEEINQLVKEIRQRARINKERFDRNSARDNMRQLNKKRSGNFIVVCLDRNNMKFARVSKNMYKIQIMIIIDFKIFTNLLNYYLIML